MTRGIAIEKKKLLEQYFTPAKISLIMADMFSTNPGQTLTVLDPCCGVGNLAAAVLTRAERKGEKSLITLIEMDKELIQTTKENFRNIPEALIIQADFFSCVKSLPKFDRIILNPPYTKISSDSKLASSCKDLIGYREGNAYSAFITCSLKLLSQSGELVAIIPRSFCNGPSFKKFRRLILEDFNIREIYLFESRKVFWESSALQEVLILKISKTGNGVVRISHETNSGNVSTREIRNDKISFKSDPQRFIHIPIAIDDDKLLERISRYDNTIVSLGLKASTGKVVDFRCTKFLLSTRNKNSSPLLYQDNIHRGFVTFDPISSSEKKRHIGKNKTSLSLLVPRENYILIRRISFKESPTRIVAAPLLKKSYQDEYIGIENHLNYIWGEKFSLDENLCIALFAYFSTQTIDSYIRRFSGHTQINATDLNSIPVPNITRLQAFGKAYKNIETLDIIAKAEDVFFNQAGRIDAIKNELAQHI